MSAVATLTTTAGPDVAIVKVEEFDVEFAEWILNNKDIPKGEREAVRRLLRDRVRGNKHETTYKLGKDIKHEDLGRFHAKGGVGLQCCWADTRAALAQRYYWDVDMRNAQPTILQQYAEKRGWMCEKLKHFNENREEYIEELRQSLHIERWEAKEKICRVMFGGTCEGLTSFFVNELRPELFKLMDNVFNENQKKYPVIAKKPNAVRSMMANVLQTEERTCLMAMDTSLARQGRSLDVLIHDGGLVRKKDGEGKLPDEVLRRCEKDILDITGYKVSLAVKPLNTTLSLPTDDEEDEVIDDAFAARKLCELLGEHLILDRGEVWVFNKDIGMWSSDKNALERVITALNGKLVFRKGQKVYDYSGCVEKRNALIRMLPSVAPIHDGYMQSKLGSDIDKLLFVDGIYDFKTDTFTPGFDPNIVFTARMPRKFPVNRDEDKIAFIRQNTFVEPFGQKDKTTGDENTLLHELMRAATGDFIRKKALIGLGPNDCSKGMTTLLVTTAFGSYAQSFNGNALLHKGFNTESEREVTFVLKFCNARFAFSSEIRVPADGKGNVAVDGTLLKTLASGGDEIQARRLNENSRPVVNKAQLFIFANDMPKISPQTTDVQSKIVPVNWSISFVDTPILPNEKKRNPEMSHLYKQPEYGDAFVHIILDEYRKWKSTGYAEIQLPDTAKIGLDDLIPSKRLGQILIEKYEITGVVFDTVSFDEIKEYVKEQGWEGTDNKLGRELTSLGLNVSKKREGKRIVHLRLGIKERAE
jgi:hypothetical protein